MEIVVVDDHSTNGEAEEVVSRLAPERVVFHRNEANQGLAGNWNRCLSLSRGQLVHLLHQDDLVLPGFYRRLGEAFQERPDLGMAFCRHAYIDGQGHRIGDGEPPAPKAGVPEAWLETIAVNQRLECPAVVVRRDVYERLGGYDPGLYYALDWEMWVRIAARYPAWYEPEILACYRRHADNESARLARSNRQLFDILKTVDAIMRMVPPSRRDALRREAERNVQWRRLLFANELMATGRHWSALSEVWRAFRLEGPVVRGRVLLGYARWALKRWLRAPRPD